MNFKPHKNLIKTINVILVIMFALCGCTKKPPEVKPDEPDEEIITEIDEDELRGFPEGYQELPQELGNSAALSYSPLEGFYIEAEENAFWQDTTITMKQVETVSDTVFDSINELIEEGMYPIGMFEVDGGLDDHEIIPGEYTVSVDPAIFNIDPDLYPCIKVFRIGDDGTSYECASQYVDGKIVYRADQNSVIEWAIASGLILSVFGGISYVEGQRSLEYFYKSNKKSMYTYEGKNNYASYRIFFNMQDMDKDQAELATRLEEIIDNYNNKADQIYKEYEDRIKDDNFGIPDLTNATKVMSEVMKEAAMADEEYKQLAKQLKLPEIVKKVAEYTDLAFDYLKNQEDVEMPTGVVEITCTPKGGNLAEASTRNYHEGYVELHLAEVMNANRSANYNLLLTMTHEILHVCQQKYRYFFADSNRYDEMVAVNMEKRCWDYFVGQSVIPKDLKAELSPTSYWSTLKLPLNDSCDKKEVMKNEGYLLSLFVDYLSERTGKTPDAGTLMKARSKIAEPGITEPLKSVFEIDEKEIDAHYTTFIRAHRKDLASQYNVKEREYKPNEPIQLAKGGKYRVMISPEGGYSSEIQGFLQPDSKPMTLLMVPDEGIHYVHPELLLIPADSYKTFRTGAYIGPVDEDQLKEQNLYRDILHIHGYKTGPHIAETTGELYSGYMIYVLDKTGRVSLNEDDDSLIVKLPKNSVAAADKVVEGYLLKLETKDGNVIEKELSQEYFDKEYTIKKKDIYGDKDIKEPLSVTATLCEFVKDREGNRMLGETSDPVSYVINEGDAADTGDLVWAVDTIVYLTHEDNFEYCKEYYENLQPCDTPGCVVVACTDTEYDFECNNDSCTLTTTSHPSSSSEPEAYKDIIKLPPAVLNGPKELDEWALKGSKDAFIMYSVYTSEMKEWGKGTGVTYSDGKNYGSFEKNWPEIAKDKAVFILIQGRLAVIYRAMNRKDAQSMSRKHVEMNVKEYFEKDDWR